MKVHVWGINYSPEVTGIAPYNEVLCESLTQSGHAVRMITSFSYYPAWRKLPSEERTLFRTDHLDGVTVHRCWHYVPMRVTTLKRAIHELSFVATSLLRQLFLPRPDLIIAISPPLLLGAAAWILSRFKRCPFVFHVQDLQPDAAAGLGMIQEGSLLLKALRRAELFAYTKAALVTAITPGMIRTIQKKGIAQEKLYLFLNGVELPDFWRLPEKGLFRKANGYNPEDFLVVYSGNLGRKQGLDQLIEAAALLKDGRIRIVICGDGAERERLEQQARGLRNITFVPLLAEPRYRELLVDADISIIPQQSGSGTAFFPSKLLKTLSFSSPVLAVTESGSELERAIIEGGFGTTVLPGAPEKLASVLDQLSDQRRELRDWGRAGHRFVKRFEQSGILEAFGRRIEALTGRRSVQAPDSEQSDNKKSDAE